MRIVNRLRWGPILAGSVVLAVAGGIVCGAYLAPAEGAGPPRRPRRALFTESNPPPVVHFHEGSDVGGTWYWLRSPEQEKRVIMRHYNYYCARCHGAGGHGVRDIPDVPDLTNVRWQKTRTNAQFVRAILEGRGAVMPAFRGTLTLEEAWAMARYLRSFAPGAETHPHEIIETPMPPHQELPPPKVVPKSAAPKSAAPKSAAPPLPLQAPPLPPPAAPAGESTAETGPDLAPAAPLHSMSLRASLLPRLPGGKNPNH